MNESIEWQEISGLLASGEYSSAISLLRLAQQTHLKQGNTALVNILEATCRISWACSQYRTEISWHHQASVKKENQEKQLRQQLQILVDAAKEYTSRKQEEKQAKFIKVHLRIEEEEVLPEEKSIWNRIRRFLDRQAEPSDAVYETNEIRPSPATLLTEPKPYATPETKEDSVLAIETNIATPKEASLVVYCFGHFRVYFNDIAIKTWSGSISKSIFKYMIIHREQPIPIELLMDTFWPDAEPESARRNLYQVIYQIRQAFQAAEITTPVIRSANGAYGLNTDLSVWLDYEEFMRQYKYGRQMYRKGNLQKTTTAYEAADSLHEGDFLAEERYENWTFQMREHLERTHAEMLEQLSHYYYEQKRWGICINYAQKLLHIDGCNEEAHRILMLAYYHQGQRHLALKQYYRCVETLQQELETDPMPETVKLYEQMQKNQVHFFSSQN